MTAWAAPVARQLFEGEAAREYGDCLLFECQRYVWRSTINCRPICERAVEARLRALGTGATRLGEKR